jgi:hypothetical protein
MRTLPENNPPESRRRLCAFVIADLFPQPGAGISPDLIRLPRRDTEERRSLGVAEAGEAAELYQLGGPGVGRRQAIEGLIED